MPVLRQATFDRKKTNTHRQKFIILNFTIRKDWHKYTDHSFEAWQKAFWLLRYARFKMEIYYYYHPDYIQKCSDLTDHSLE